jgi:hypothetical protein
MTHAVGEAFPPVDGERVAAEERMTVDGPRQVQGPDGRSG